MRKVLLAFVLLAACGKNEQPPPPTTGQPNAPTETGPGAKAPAGAAVAAADGDAKAEAQKTFNMLCSTCHGADGTGNGPASASLDPKPRNYTDAAWQASVTDDDLRKIILEGGPAVGKSPMMPGQPQLKDKPEVVNELIAMIRGFAK